MHSTYSLVYSVCLIISHNTLCRLKEKNLSIADTLYFVHVSLCSWEQQIEGFFLDVESLPCVYVTSVHTKVFYCCCWAASFEQIVLTCLAQRQLNELLIDRKMFHIHCCCPVFPQDCGIWSANPLETKNKNKIKLYSENPGKDGAFMQYINTVTG